MSVESTPNRSVSDSLLVFYKYPEKGFAKTRLAKEIGEEEALKVYKVLLSYTFDIINELTDTDIYLFYTTKRQGHDIDEICNSDWYIHKQSGGSLGKRFSNGFQDVLGPTGKKVVVIGTDCVGLTKDIIKEAFASLNDSDIVIGPTEDGGYYLIGMKEAHNVFQDIPWSTENVYERTIERVNDLGLDHHTLPILNDVDVKKDWERAIKEEPRLQKTAADQGTKDGFC